MGKRDPRKRDEVTCGGAPRAPRTTAAEAGAWVRTVGHHEDELAPDRLELDLVQARRVAVGARARGIGVRGRGDGGRAEQQRQQRGGDHRQVVDDVRLRKSCGSMDLCPGSMTFLNGLWI